MDKLALKALEKSKQQARLEEAAKEAERAVRYKRSEDLKRAQLKSALEPSSSNLVVPNVGIQVFRNIFGAYMQATELRIAMQLRIGALKKVGGPVHLYLATFENMKLHENSMEKEISRVVKGTRIWTGFATNKKGLGPILLGWLIYYIDVARCKTPSSLIQYCGFAVDKEGRGDRLRKGVQARFNPKLKGKLYLLAETFIMLKNPKYYNEYVKAKKKLRTRFPEAIVRPDGKLKYNDMHIHQMAIRKMMRLFLTDLYYTWSKLRGLPTVITYKERYGNRLNIKPEESSGKSKSYTIGLGGEIEDNAVGDLGD